MLPIPDTLNSGVRPPDFKVSGMGSTPGCRESGRRMPQDSGGLGGECPPEFRGSGGRKPSVFRVLGPGGEAPQDSGGSGGRSPPRVLLNLFPPQLVLMVVSRAIWDGLWVSFGIAFCSLGTTWRVLLNVAVGDHSGMCFIPFSEVFVWGL